jgi:hypothetical protein
VMSFVENNLFIVLYKMALIMFSSLNLLFFNNLLFSQRETPVWRYTRF